MKSIRIYILMAVLLLTTQAKPCTRVVYKGDDNLVLTARSMDWKEDLKSNIWLFPRGMERNGMTGPNTVKWTSKYGSVITSAYEISSTDGINEKGLVANLLWLAESSYPEFSTDKKTLTISAWVQYVLDNYATVSEAVTDLEKEHFTVISDKMPTEDRMATLHLSISDAEGDNAIFEYIDGKLVIHHDPSYLVMTNSPVFEKQLALNEYWKGIGGTVMLPGTNRAADRFVRASFYTRAIPKTADYRVGVASIFSVIRNCSVPYGISTPDQPNISSTLWRTVSDSKNKVYYFDSVLVPNVFWINLKELDFSKGASVKKINLTNGETYLGNASKAFKKAEPFVFIGLPNM